jgi:hypothetical protein
MESKQKQKKDLLWTPELGSRNGDQLRSSEMKPMDRRTDAHYGENLIWEQEKNISLLFPSQLPFFTE